MTEIIARDAGWTPKPGLEVYDKDGQKVGQVDQASDAQGWMQVEAWASACKGSGSHTD